MRIKVRNCLGRSRLKNYSLATHDIDVMLNLFQHLLSLMVVLTNKAILKQVQDDERC